MAAAIPCHLPKACAVCTFSLLLLLLLSIFCLIGSGIGELLVVVVEWQGGCGPPSQMTGFNAGTLPRPNQRSELEIWTVSKV